MKYFKVVIWIGIFILASVGIFSCIMQMPPNAKSYNPGFADYPITTWLHTIPGALFMILAPMQFIPAIRRKYPIYHRWAGRVVLLSCLILGISASIILFTFPYTSFDPNLSNLSEQIPDIFFGTFFLLFAALGYYNIRKGNIEKHRRYMIRVFAIGLGISLFRILMVVTAIAGTNPLELIGIYFWLGFAITWILAEIYIKFRKVTTNN